MASWRKKEKKEQNLCWIVCHASHPLPPPPLSTTQSVKGLKWTELNFLEALRSFSVPWSLCSDVFVCLFNYSTCLALSWSLVAHLVLHNCNVPAGLPSRGGDVAVYVFDIKQLSLPTPFFFFLILFFILFLCAIFMAFSTVFHSINFPQNSPLSHSVLLVLFLPYLSF